jgi:hypothetical protein
LNPVVVAPTVVCPYPETGLLDSSLRLAAAICPAAAAAESMNGYIAIDEADILGAGEEKADEPVIDGAGCKDALKGDILLC